MYGLGMSVFGYMLMLNLSISQEIFFWVKKKLLLSDALLIYVNYFGWNKVILENLSSVIVRRQLQCYQRQF